MSAQCGDPECHDVSLRLARLGHAKKVWTERCSASPAYFDVNMAGSWSGTEGIKGGMLHLCHGDCIHRSL